MDLEAIWKTWSQRAQAAADKFTQLSFGKRFLILFAAACVSALIYGLAVASEKAAVAAAVSSTVGQGGSVYLAASNGPEWLLIMQVADGCPAGLRTFYLSPKPKIMQACSSVSEEEVVTVIEDGDVLVLPRKFFVEIGKKS